MVDGDGERSNQHFPESRVPWVRALFSEKTEEDFSLTTLVGSHTLLSSLSVVFHSLICSVITTKNDREQFRLYLREVFTGFSFLRGSVFSLVESILFISFHSLSFRFREYAYPREESNEEN